MIEVTIYAGCIVGGFILGYIVCAIYLGERIEQMQRLINFLEKRLITSKSKLHVVETAEERNFIIGKLNWNNATNKRK